MGDQTIADTSSSMRSSEALPWLPRPTGLDSVKIAGGFGFDPLGLGSSKETILKYRAAEIKHCRLAMLAAAGWQSQSYMMVDSQSLSVHHLQLLKIMAYRLRF